MPFRLVSCQQSASIQCDFECPLLLALLSFTEEGVWRCRRKRRLPPLLSQRSPRLRGILAGVFSACVFLAKPRARSVCNPGSWSLWHSVVLPDSRARVHLFSLRQVHPHARSVTPPNHRVRRRSRSPSDLPLRTPRADGMAEIESDLERRLALLQVRCRSK